MIDFDDGSATVSSGLLPDTIIYTPEIERLNRFIIESLRMQSRGCAVMGQQCNGKSFATRYLMSLLPETLGHTVAVVRWSISAPETRLSRTDRAFTQERMLQSGCTSVVHRDLAVLWRRLVAHLAELAIAAGSRWIVIMVDEAQNLTYEEYNRLIHCFNCLEDAKVKPFFMLVGQPELASVTSSWKETNGMQVIGRFFTRTLWFRGVGLDHLEAVLDSLDEALDGDEAKRISSQLMPQVLGTGWTLARWAPLYRDALATLMTKHSIAGGLYLPMQMMRSSVLLLLDRQISQKSDPRTLSAATVLQALDDTGFTSTLAYYVDPQYEKPQAQNPDSPEGAQA